MKKVVSLVLIALVVLVAGCSRPWFGLGRKAAHVSPAADTESGQKQASTEDGRRVVAAAALDELIRLREAPQQKADAGKVRSALEGAIPVSVRGGVREPNHQRYLGEPMVFSPLPPDPYPGQKIAVAAADGMQLYTDSLAPLAGRREKILALIASDGLVPVTAIPVGTVLPLLGVYQDKGGTEGEEGWYDGLFRYRNDLNWFYLTEYKGTRGIVWGAGLRGAILRRPQKQYSGPFDEEIRTLDSAEVMRLSYYYTKPRKGAVWVPFIGSRQIDEEAAKSLEKNRILFEQTVFGRRNDYNLWIDQPDDLIALYLLQKEDPNAGGHPHRLDANPDSPLYDRNRGIPTFVTTDLVAHCLHLLFDRMLAQMEEERLFLGMARLVARLQAKARELPGRGCGHASGVRLPAPAQLPLRRRGAHPHGPRGAGRRRQRRAAGQRPDGRCRGQAGAARAVSRRRAPGARADPRGWRARGSRRSCARGSTTRSSSRAGTTRGQKPSPPTSGQHSGSVRRRSTSTCAGRRRETRRCPMRTSRSCTAWLPCC